MIVISSLKEFLERETGNEIVNLHFSDAESNLINEEIIKGELNIKYPGDVGYGSEQGIGFEFKTGRYGSYVTFAEPIRGVREYSTKFVRNGARFTPCSTYRGLKTGRLVVRFGVSGISAFEGFAEMDHHEAVIALGGFKEYFKYLAKSAFEKQDNMCVGFDTYNIDECGAW